MNLQFKSWVNCLKGNCRKLTYEQLLQVVANLVKKAEEPVSVLSGDSITLKKEDGDPYDVSHAASTEVMTMSSSGEIGTLDNTTFAAKVKTATDGFTDRLRTVNFTGNGGSATIAIPHGLSTTPSFYSVVGANAASAGVTYVTADATNINAHFTAATASGTNNIQLMVTFKA